ncbi:MAG: hypothetical protein JJU36_05015 [Phycisphaeraceae bacterium]|nr:hypothetical protein [Phycisphaeraceae bacterium]
MAPSRPISPRLVHHCKERIHRHWESSIQAGHPLSLFNLRRMFLREWSRAVGLAALKRDPSLWHEGHRLAERHAGRLLRTSKI